VIFREDVEAENVFENRLSPTEIKDGYLNLSNMVIPGRCFFDEDRIKVLMINTDGEAQGVVFRCHERKASGKREKIYKRQRFWPVDFGLKEWFHHEQLGPGDLLLLAVSARNNYLIFRAIRPKTLMMLHDRRDTERRALERRFEDRRRTLVFLSVDRRRRDRRKDERRTNDRRDTESQE
jgi:hypothetical protein